MTAVDRLNGVHSGLGQKAPVRVATTANVTLSGLQTIDGVTLEADDRILVKDQTTTSENGIYAATPAPGRAPRTSTGRATWHRARWSWSRPARSTP